MTSFYLSLTRKCLLLMIALGLFLFVWSSTSFAQHSCFEPSPWWVDDYYYYNSLTDTFDKFNAIQGQWIQPNACACMPGYKKVKKKLYTDSSWTSSTERVTICEKCDPSLCNCGVKLNTPIPFVGSCIMFDNHNTSSEDGTTTVTGTTAFPVLMGAVMRILVGVILVVWFWMIVAGWFMMTVPGQYDKGKKLIFKVIQAIIALWLLGAILYLINPNFFV